MSGQNAATRVHSVIQHAAAIDGQLPVVDGLYELFHLGHLTPGVGAGRQAAQRMNQLLDQIDLIAAGLASAGVPGQLWEAPLEQARNGFSPTLLGSTWAQVTENFPPEVHLTLQWAAHVLPPDDGMTDATQVGQLLLDVEEVLMLAEQIELPDVLRQFVSGHMHALQEGLRVSAVSGMRPLREAIKTVAGDLALRQETIKRAVAGLAADAHAVCSRASTSVKKAMDIVNQASEPVDTNQKLGSALGTSLSLLG
ncbi:MAG: hypothetical protein AB9M53_10440 [Leptothrix sp. (in: b-proteobacteria)]